MTCTATYERPGGRDRGDRIVSCHLPAGHPGEHEESDTDVTWESESVATPAHLVPRRSDRGLAYLPLIHGGVGYGGSVQVYESSGAEHPRIWLDADCGDGEKGVVHLELADAVKLAEQLMWLAENHYQIREGS